MTSQWAWWRLKSPASRLLTQSFIQTQIKENIKTPRHWPLCGEFTGYRWIPRTNGQLHGKCFHLMTSSWRLGKDVSGMAWSTCINYSDFIMNAMVFRPLDCLFKRLFRRRSKKTSKLHVTGFFRGIHPWQVYSPHKGPVTRKNVSIKWRHHVWSKRGLGYIHLTYQSKTKW